MASTRDRAILVGTIVAILVVVLTVALANEIMDGTAQTAWCGEYCEDPRPPGVCDARAIPIQPVNTATNIAYAILGMLAFWRRRQDLSATWFLLSSLLLTAGSAWFHANPTGSSHLADIGSVTLLFSFLATYSVFATNRIKGYWLATLIALAVGIGLVLFLARNSDTGTLVIAICGVIIISQMVLSVLNGHRSWGMVLGILLVYGVAFGARELDFLPSFCDPTSLLQWHGVWHIISAIGIYLTYTFFDDIRGQVTQLP